MKRFSVVTKILFAVVLAMLTTLVYGIDLPLTLVGYTALAFLPSEQSILGLNSTNNASARDTYQHARRLLYNAMRDKFVAGASGDDACTFWVDGRKLSQNELRLEVQLLTTVNLYTFGVTPQQASSSNTSPFITERRLELQDTMIASEYGIFVGNPASATDTAWQLKTYGNNQVFTQAQADALNTTFYSNGYFQLKCNNDVVAPYRGLWNHYYVPETQATAAPGAGSPIDQQRGAEDGFITQEPNILIIGAKNYVPTIVLPGNLTSVGTFARAILVYRGIYAQNSTVVN